MKYSIFTEPPEDFHPTVEVAGCYFEWGDKILLLKRHPEKPYGNTWGIPAGKMEKNETPRDAVIREIQEEVGININDDNLEMVGKLYCRLPHVDYIFHRFRKHFSVIPEINLELNEHLEMRWVTIDEALKLPLIVGGKESLSYYKQQRC